MRGSQSCNSKQQRLDAFNESLNFLIKTMIPYSTADDKKQKFLEFFFFI